MSRVVSVGPDVHHCAPGWAQQDGHWVQYGIFACTGTVVRCECGTTFVAYYQDPRVTGDLTAQWRREWRLEKWDRERRQRKADRMDAQGRT